MSGELDALIKFVGERFVFNEEAYPELKGKTPEEVFRFAVRHEALHYAKTAGKIVAVAEDADHGDPIDTAELKKNLIKSIINSLKLAETLGVTEAEISERIKKYWD